MDKDIDFTDWDDEEVEEHTGEIFHPFNELEVGDTFKMIDKKDRYPDEINVVHKRDNLYIWTNPYSTYTYGYLSREYHVYLVKKKESKRKILRFDNFNEDIKVDYDDWDEIEDEDEKSRWGRGVFSLIENEIDNGDFPVIIHLYKDYDEKFREFCRNHNIDQHLDDLYLYSDDEESIFIYIEPRNDGGYETQWTESHSNYNNEMYPGHPIFTLEMD